MASSRWQEIGDFASEQEAKSFVNESKNRLGSSTHCKFQIRVERRKHWYGNSVETRYIVRSLCEGVY